MTCLNEVVAIFDMDGFLINKKFFCKELGIIRVGNVTAQSYFFDIGVKWQDLSLKDKATCKYVIQRVHKLPFGVPRGADARSLSLLGDIVTDAYRGMKRNENSTMAYKGGHYEKDLLKSLGIPSVNLEEFGCPKAEALIEQMFWLETCGKHIVSEAYSHCPKVEVEAYAQWVEKQ